MNGDDHLTVRSGQGDYRVNFVSSLISAARELSALQDAFIIADAQVLDLHHEALAPLEKFPTHRIPALEDEKTLAGVERFLGFLQKNNATKQSHVVAIGGGIIQDITTFSVHVYYRGIPWSYLPTTLLGMSDSCIGAKCGINFNEFKNQLGVFQSPSRVLICEEFLATLSDDDVRSGYGEIVKLLLTGSAAQFAQLEDEVSLRGFRNPKLSYFIRESLGVKKAVIEKDEYEVDLRRILNYGHTFGHSLEAVTGHGVPHGLAVAWGVDAANYVSMRKGLLPETDYRRIHDFIKPHFKFETTAPYSATTILEGMKRDKKAAGGQVFLILLERPGRLKIVSTPLDAALEGFLADYLASEDVFSRD